MRFIVIGAGAIGGTTAAYLIRAGYEVLLIDNAVDHVRAIQADGLTIEGRLDFKVKATAVTPETLARAMNGQVAEAVVLAVKAQHTTAALEPLLPFLGPDSFVLSMQNGLNPKAVSELVGARRTLASFINSMGTDYLSPGRIMYGGPGTIYIGELNGRMTRRVEWLVTILKASFVENTNATTNIWGYLWGKESFGAMLFAGATVDETIATLLGEPANRSLLADIAGEVLRVADAEGVQCEPFDGYVPDVMRFMNPRKWTEIALSLDSLALVYRRSLKQKSGIWRDLAIRHRPTEVDAQLGIVSDLARVHRIRVPLIERVVEMIHEMEHGVRPMVKENLDELRQLDKQCYPSEPVE